MAVSIALVLLIALSVLGATTNAWAWLTRDTPLSTLWLLAAVIDAVVLLAALGVLCRRYRAGLAIMLVFAAARIYYLARFEGLTGHEWPPFVAYAVLLWYGLAHRDQLR